MRVSWKDILLAYEFADFGGMASIGHRAFLCKESGRIYLHSDSLDDLEELPDDLEENEKYLPIPNKRELDLGKPLVFEFARQFLPSDFDPENIQQARRLRQIQGPAGAAARTRSMVRFQEKATERALREWCELNSIELGD
jgi:hypothetical protein